MQDVILITLNDYKSRFLKFINCVTLSKNNKALDTSRAAWINTCLPYLFVVNKLKFVRLLSN
jgi:hypothetical protein